MHFLAFAALLGCSGEGMETADRATGPLDGGWPAELAADPAAFGTLVSSGRDGWIALHRGELHAAHAELEGAARARTARELSLAYADLDRLADTAWPRTFALWQERSGLEAGSALPLVAALEALDRGDGQAARGWLEQAGEAQDPEVQALVAALKASEAGGLEPSGLEAGPSTCVDLQLRVRGSGAVETLGDCGTAPLVVESTAAGGERRLYDPLVFRTLSEAWAVRAGEEAPQGELATLIFSEHWTAADQAAALAGEVPPTLVALGLDRPPPSADEVEWARERVRDLDRALDEWEASAHDAAGEDGKALLEDLDLVGVFRSRLLTSWAREALAADRPHQALAYAQLALDASSSRSVGPLNAPSLFVVLADANLRTGRTREALDSLQPLEPSWPTVHGLDETIGDLVILEGLTRLGDSKEN